MSGGQILGPAKRPCDACPYKVTTPSGVWSAEDYRKLERYDLPQQSQPSAVFLCHANARRLCAGWVGCHDTDRLLALRVAQALRWISPAVVAAARRYISPVPVFASGRAAAVHGLADIDAPSPQARRAIDRLTRKVAARGIEDAVGNLPVPEGPPTHRDTLIWPVFIAMKLTELGYTAQPISVTGWADRQQRVAVLHHHAVLTTPKPTTARTRPGPGPGAGSVVVDVTARMFDPNLPDRWITDWDRFATELAHATGTATVTHSPPTPPPTAE